MSGSSLSVDRRGTPMGRPELRIELQGVEVWRGLEQVVAAAFAVPLHELRAAQRRRAQVAFARQVTMYVAHTAFGMPYPDIGLLSRRDRKTVAYACERIERRRDDPAINCALELIEAASLTLVIRSAGDLRVRS